jgi:hypothetical protein
MLINIRDRFVYSVTSLKATIRGNAKWELAKEGTIIQHGIGERGEEDQVSSVSYIYLDLHLKKN